MGATAARDIVSVSNSHAVINDPLMGQITVPISELPRTELMRAASMRFPQSGVLWRNLGNEVIAAAITTGNVPAPSDDPNAVVPYPAPVIPPLESSYTPPTTNGSKPTNGDAAKLAEIIRSLASSAVPATIDESRIRGIVTQSIADLMPQIAEIIEQEIQSVVSTVKPTINQIVLPNLETRTIEGIQHKDFPALLRTLSVGVHAYLVGPPGTGKTFMAHQAANALGIPFASISCSPTMPDSRLFGFIDASGTYRRTLFRDIYENGGVFLFDEIDNAHPGIIAAMNQALANDYCAFPDGMVERHSTTRFVAAANTFGTGATRQFVGRNALDAATLDRFAFLVIGIDESIEEAVTLAINPAANIWLSSVREWRSNAESHKLDVIISPRAAFHGAKLILAGFSFDECREMTVGKGMSDDARSKVF